MATTDVYREKLEQERERIERELSSIATKNKEGEWSSTRPQFNSDDNVDLENETDEVEAYVNRLPLEQNFERRLAAIGRALERIEAGTYGTCSNCNKPIPKKRLDIMPEAEMCLDCASK